MGSPITPSVVNTRQDTEDTTPLPERSLSIEAAGTPAPPGRRSDRFAALDGLRGVAAAVVTLHHALLVIPPGPIVATSVGRATLTIIGPVLLLSGNLDEAVLIFFALSGFVLALQAKSGRVPTYRAFLVRRLFRIYLPYLTAFSFSLALVIATAPWAPRFGEASLLDDWNRPVDVATVLNTALMTGYDNWVDTPMWTFVYEMRVSLVFPLLIAPALAFGLPGFLVPSAALLAAWLLIHFSGLPSSLIDNLAYTVPIAFTVLAGAVVALKLETIRIRGERSLAATDWLLLVFGLALTMAAFPFHAGHKTVSAAVGGIGSATVLAACVIDGPVARLLRRRLSLFLGRISFSLFLLHTPIIIATLRVTRHVLPTPLGVLLALTLSVGAALAGEAFVERPATQLGRWLTRRPGVPLEAATEPLPPSLASAGVGSVAAGPVGLAAARITTPR